MGQEKSFPRDKTKGKNFYNKTRLPLDKPLLTSSVFCVSVCW